MEKYITYVGMDVHARSVDARMLVPTTGETCRKTFSQPTAADIAQWLQELPQPVYCAYESGCTGFWMARDLRGLGYDCDVIAVSTLPRSTKDRQQKCDKLDAKAILREITNPASDYTTVWIPDAKTEASRNLMRSYQVAKDNVKHAKQRLLAFLLTYGYVWSEKTKTGRPKAAWTRDFFKWLDGIVFEEPAARYAFESYRRHVRDATDEVKTMRAYVLKVASLPENKPYVDALRCVKCIQTESAMLVRAEFGDFRRFSSGGRASGWVGVVPTNHSSGQADIHGPITKAGNKYVRRTLVEGISGISTWKSPKKAIPEGVEVSGAVQDIAARCNKRMLDRYTHLRVDNHLQANKAKVAMVNELVRWIWAIGLQVQSELQAS